MAGDVEIAVRGRNLLGEGIIWSPDHAEVQWTDIHGKVFWSFDPERRTARSIVLPERLACFAPLGGSRILAGFASGLAYFNLASGERETIATVEDDQPTTRLNDGKLDRQGRLFLEQWTKANLQNQLGESGASMAAVRALCSTAFGFPIRLLFRRMGASCISPTRRNG